MKSNVTATISTKDRYFTSLPNCLISLANQTVVPDKIIIFDDGEHKDLRNEEIYKNIFSLFRDKGIAWEVVFGEGKGQVRNHQKALEIVETDFIWRLDDDNIAEANVLEELLGLMSSKVGAVGGLVLDPKIELKESKLASNKIEDIYLGMNLQWFKRPNPKVLVEVDHLYSTFLFRKEAAKHGYNLELSPKGHREETLFTYEIKRNGWRLLVAPDLITWHFRNSQGGIRSGNNDAFLFEHDERVFSKKLQEWEVIPNKYKFFICDMGLGDSIVFSKLIPEIKEKYKDYRLIFATCYREVFGDFSIEEISIAEARMICNIDEYNIYRWMIDHKWNKSIEEAIRGMYDI